MICIIIYELQCFGFTLFVFLELYLLIKSQISNKILIPDEMNTESFQI